MGKIIILCAIFLMVGFFFKWKKGDGTHNHHHGTGHKHGEGFSIDFYAYTSKIRHWNATFKVSLSVLILILCIVLENPYVSVVVIIAMAYLTIVKGELPVNEYLSILAIPIIFILLGTFTIAIDFSKQPMGQYNLYLGFCYVFTSQAKLKEVAFLILKVFAAISALQMMTLSTPSSEIIYVLRKAHVPKLIVELMNLIYRYIFILMDVYTKMKNSAESRQGYCDFKTSCYTFGSIASNMLVISLKKANDYYDAMEARCYDGDLIFLEEDKKVETIQIASAVVFIIFLILIWGVTR
ncbi:cobalt ECF transporter T component CbiQ [Clostridium sp. CF011]|uniref:cobalt ECF transporter T component CbiQ n=2 Tax=Clostridium TaxID=1485 RepID=UPI001C0CD587|nr:MULTISPECIES: cobalt ECF transporter T component CbiQ [unclassified Clostridium]MBU3093137.1 cobalt ECF transporter T component CbiQ [Clostridium sp. CF011]MBW9147099.1 cobalt ECF transporter T component CbiQ [Clostridium sp. CM027]UVE39554.1 cobalt ECF transporter T component CbiQ [Clostridium sp. CM027]WAG68458.1 cobalt ECF transporter T component CbiQ [Clostridium sp. CF011]